MPEYLISCEYATCTVPESYRGLFRGDDELVTSSAGWEPGALNLAQAFAMRFRTPLLHTEITRLLLDIEQADDERWSRYSRELPSGSQKRLEERYDEPFRNQLDGRIADGIRRSGEVLHIMVHTDSETRGQVVIETPAGCQLSERYGAAWQSRMKHDELRVVHQANGKGTVLSNRLLEEYGGRGYAQIRLKVSQGFFLEGLPWRWATLKKHILDSLMLATQHDVSRGRVDQINGRGCPATLPR